MRRIRTINIRPTITFMSFTVDCLEIVNLRRPPLSFTFLIRVDCLVAPVVLEPYFMIEDRSSFFDGRCRDDSSRWRYVLGVGSGSWLLNIRTVISVVS